MLLLNVTPVLRGKYAWKRRQMGGGIFGGHKKGIKLYYDRYTQFLLQRKTSNTSNSEGMSFLSEQKAMYELCVTSPELCFVIQAKQRNGGYGRGLEHPYFFLLPYFNTFEYERLKEDGII